MTYVDSASILIEDTARPELTRPLLVRQPDRAQQMVEWNLATRIAFRFVFASSSYTRFHIKLL